MNDRTWYGEQDENGVDLSLIRENLKLTPEERLLKGDRARRAVMEMQKIAPQQRAKSLGDSPAYAELEKNGVDLALIRENLRLTPEQRLLKAERARRAALEETERQHRGNANG